MSATGIIFQTVAPASRTVPEAVNIIAVVVSFQKHAGKARVLIGAVVRLTYEICSQTYLISCLQPNKKVKPVKAELQESLAHCVAHT